MTLFAWLGLAVLVTAIAAVTGIKHKGTRHPPWVALSTLLAWQYRL